MTDHGQMEIIASERNDDGFITVTCVCRVCGRVIRFGVRGEFQVIQQGDFEARHYSGINVPGLEVETGKPTVGDVWGELLDGIDFGGLDDDLG